MKEKLTVEEFNNLPAMGKVIALNDRDRFVKLQKEEREILESSSAKGDIVLKSEKYVVIKLDKPVFDYAPFVAVVKLNNNPEPIWRTLSHHESIDEAVLECIGYNHNAGKDYATFAYRMLIKSEVK